MFNETGLTKYSVLRFYKDTVGQNLLTFHKPCLEAKALVCKEIQDETDRITGKTKQISPVPIHLSICAPNFKTDFSCS
uniref:Uncharacterized protein n=1 Tax=Quercus lobata TaxID=97700 RepID=A0A7N2MC57_QUELO